jgi:hypothetical protein
MSRGNLGAFAQELVTNVPSDPLAQLQAQVKALVERERARDKGRLVPPGALVEYYSDLSSGVLAPENMRIDDIHFRVQIDPAGNITFSTQPVQVISMYNFSFRRLMAYAMNPQFTGAAPALVSFNISDAGRDFSVFKTPINLQSLLANGGAGNVAEFDGIYTTVPGTQLVVSWFVDTARWPALVGSAQEFGIQIVGDLTACRPGR